MLKKYGLYFSAALLLPLIFALPTGVLGQGEKQMATAILIDNTGSMRSQLDEVLAISKGIVGRSYPRGPVSLFNFETQGDKRTPLAVVTSGTPWSQDRYLLEDYIDNIFIVPGQTALLDSINSIADQLDAKVAAGGDAFAGKIIFLITDGEERVSRIKDKQLVERLKKSGIKVYAVGLVNELDKNGGAIKKISKGDAMKLLERMATETGGRAVFPDSKKRDADALLKELFAQPVQ
ncbi:MAG TPA: VWA domain-containing protein [Nitrososphaera sp.]|nr:VWA domain-containing protein [Nitrososphaera sp.]